MSAHVSTRLARADLEAEHVRFQEADQLALMPVTPRGDYAQKQQVRAQQSPGRQNLERFERALAFLFNHCGVKLGYLQVRLLNAARIVLLRRMFGADLVNEIDYLRARFGIKALYDNVAIMFPRRVGKTTVQTIVAACVAVSQFEGNVCCFNIKGRQARAWLSQTIKWMRMFQHSPEFKWEELNVDAKETILIKNCTGTTARVSSYPGTCFIR